MKVRVQDIIAGAGFEPANEKAISLLKEIGDFEVDFAALLQLLMMLVLALDYIEGALENKQKEG